MKYSALISVLLITLFSGMLNGKTAQMKREKAMKVFLEDPNFLSAKLSPDGQNLAFLINFEGKRNLMILDLESKEFLPGKLNAGMEFSSYAWIDSDTIVFAATRWDYYYEGIYSFDVKKEKIQLLLDVADDRFIFRGFADTLPQVPKTFMGKGFYQGSDPVPHLYKIRTDSSSLAMESARNTGDIAYYVADAEGNPVFAIENIDASTRVLKRDNDSWELFSESDKKLIPIGFMDGKDYLIFSERNDEKYAGIGLYDLNSGERVGDPRFIDGYDLMSTDSRVIRDNRTGRLMGIQFHHQKPQNFLFTSNLMQLDRLIKSQFNDHSIFYYGFSGEGKYLYFSIENPQLPEEIYQLDLENGKVTFVISKLPKARELELRPTEPIAFLENENRKLEGYVTKPLGDGPYPTIFLIHGGPMLRNTWGFNSAVQFLASQGYAVIQVNYRGSTGYGLKHEIQRLGRIGKASVEDLVFAIDWAVEEGIAKQDQVIAMGSSYGGYISTQLALHHSDKIAMAISNAGVYDWLAIYKQDTKRKHIWADDLFHGYDEEVYAEISPITYAQKLDVPILVAHGNADQRVGISQAKAFVRKLEKHDKNVVFERSNWGVHGFPDEEKRMDFYELVLDFIEENLARN